MTPREKIEKASEAFTEACLSDSQDFLACEKHHRKRLLTMDLYEVEDVHEKAMKAGYNLAIEQACEYLKRFVCTSDVIETNEKGEPLADSFVEVSKRRLEAEKAFIEDFKQAMKL